MGPLPLASPSTPHPTCSADCSREVQEVASSPWKRLHANSKLSDIERVRALPWQKKSLRNPENTGCDAGNTLLAEPERDSLAVSRIKRLISP